MPRRVFVSVLAVVVSIGVLSESARAIELARLLGVNRNAPAAVPTAHGYSAGVPAPHRYPEYSQCSPWYGYGFGVPTYSWGSFGAKYHGEVICHRGYYGDFYQWGYRRGY